LKPRSAKIKDTFWSTANRAFSAKERKAYNKWRHDLYVAADRLRDYVRFLPDEANSHDGEWRERCLKAMLDRVTDCPIMLP